MCKYCDFGKDHKWIMYDDIDFGIFGEGAVQTGICGTLDHEKELQTYVGFGDCDGDVIVTTKINYCPMCGKKL